MSAQTKERRPAGEPSGIHNPTTYNCSKSTPDPDMLWWANAAEVVADLAAAGQHFTVDSIRPLVGDPVSGARWGSLLAALQARGVIVGVGWQRVARPHWTQLVRTWQGVAK